jgi:hypothetical protein
MRVSGDISRHIRDYRRGDSRVTRLVDCGEVVVVNIGCDITLFFDDSEELGRFIRDLIDGYKKEVGYNVYDISEIVESGE